MIFQHDWHALDCESSARCAALLVYCNLGHAAVNDSLAHFVTRNGSQLQVLLLVLSFPVLFSLASCM